VRADSAIQFDLPPLAPPLAPPAWLQWLLNALSGLGPLFQILFWIALIAIVAAIVYAIEQRMSGAEPFWARRKAKAAPIEDWRPEEAPARALLAEADALADAGRFDEAAHLLLFRSIEEIDRRRPAVVRPALTSREIVRAPQLPEGPRGAFGRIVEAVETSLFGGRRLGEGEWRTCRAAYEEFAFAKAWAG